jgi:hypothetical protein
VALKQYGCWFGGKVHFQRLAECAPNAASGRSFILLWEFCNVYFLPYRFTLCNSAPHASGYAEKTTQYNPWCLLSRMQIQFSIPRQHTRSLQNKPFIQRGTCCGCAIASTQRVHLHVKDSQVKYAMNDCSTIGFIHKVDTYSRLTIFYGMGRSTSFHALWHAALESCVCSMNLRALSKKGFVFLTTSRSAGFSPTCVNSKQ